MMNTNRVFLVAFQATIILRFASLPFYSFGPVAGMMEAYAALKARDMVNLTPMLWGIPDWNQPPLHSWILALSGNIFGWDEFGLRIPSYFAWLATAIPVSRMSKHPNIATMLWLLFPLSMTYAGRVGPDMFLTMSIAFVAWNTWRGKTLQATIWFFVGMLIKPVMVFALPAILLNKKRATFTMTSIAFVSSLLILYVLNPVAFNGIFHHVEGRGTGHWQFPLLYESLALGTALLFPLMFYWKPDWRLSWVAMFTLFFLYAAPEGGHQYYLLPILPFVATIIADVIGNVPKKFIATAIATCLLASTVTLWNQGDFGDTRTRDLASQTQPPTYAQGGMHYVASWYHDTRVESFHRQQGNYTMWHFGDHPDCETMVKLRSNNPQTSIDYVSCGNVTKKK